MFKVIDLFAGIGGFSLGLEATGAFQTIAFCEQDKFCQAVLKNTGQESPSTQTSKPSPSKESATSSQAATLAPHFPLLGSKKALKMTATSGRTCLKLLHKKNPLMSFAKMFMVTSAWASTRCYLTWRVKTTPACHLLLELVPSMRPTGDKGSLSSQEKM